MQEPSLGRIVWVLTDPNYNNGSDVCPAFVTRVFGGTEDAYTVNLRLIRDAAPSDFEWRTSATLYEDRTAAEAGLHDKAVQLSGSHQGGLAAASGSLRASSMFAFWPPRTS